MRPACEPNIKLRLKTTPQRVALAKMSLCSRKTSTPRRVVRVLSGAAPPPRSQERRTSLTLPKGKGKSLGQLGQRRCSAGDPGAACDRAGRRALTSASSLHCGSEGNSNFTSSMVPGPRRVGAVRPAAPRAGRGDKGRRAGGGREEGGLTRGGLTASTCGPQGPGGCDRKAKSRAVRCWPPCCGRLPPAGLRAPQTAGIRPRHEPITVSSRPSPRATANPSPRSPTARPRRRQVSARLRPAGPRARRRGGRGLPRGGAAAEGREERSGRRQSAVRPARPSQMGWESLQSAFHDAALRGMLPNPWGKL